MAINNIEKALSRKLKEVSVICTEAGGLLWRMSLRDVDKKMRKENYEVLAVMLNTLKAKTNSLMFDFNSLQDIGEKNEKTTKTF